MGIGTERLIHDETSERNDVGKLEIRLRTAETDVRRTSTRWAGPRDEKNMHRVGRKGLVRAGGIKLPDRTNDRSGPGGVPGDGGIMVAELIAEQMLAIQGEKQDEIDGSVSLRGVLDLGDPDKVNAHEGDTEGGVIPAERLGESGLGGDLILGGKLSHLTGPDKDELLKLGAATVGADLRRIAPEAVGDPSRGAGEDAGANLKGETLRVGRDKHQTSKESASIIAQTNGVSGVSVKSSDSTYASSTRS